MNLSTEKWANVQRYNDCLERLIVRRKSEITATFPLLESKTVWKCSVLQQSLLYRATSEFCHPNGRGHLSTYGEINKTNGILAFSEAAPNVLRTQGHVIICFMLLTFVESVMDTFDQVVLAIPDA